MATEHTKAMQEKARKAALQHLGSTEHNDTFEEGYLRAVEDCLAVIEKEREEMVNVRRSMTADAISVIATKIRNPEPEVVLPEVVKYSVEVLRDIALHGTLPGHQQCAEEAADALEAEARKGGWK